MITEMNENMNEPVEIKTNECLSDFFAENAEKVENIFVVVSKRFKDKDGNPREWEIQPVGSEKESAIRESCMVTKRAPGKSGKRGRTVRELDANKYIGELCAEAVVSPNLRKSDLQDSYGVKTPIELLQKMLLPGELNELVATVNELCGLTDDFEDEIEEVKNS